MNNKMKAAKRTIILLLAGLALFLLCLFTISPNFKQKKMELVNATFINSTTPLENNFFLVDINNTPFTRNNLKGKWTLLFFGYADCPSICPVTLGIVKDALNNIQNKKHKPNFIFASLNPEQDSAPKLQKFLHKFSEDFNGLTGNKADMDKLSQQLNIVAIRNTSINNDLNNSNDKSNNSLAKEEIINHSAILVLIDPKAQVKAIISPPLNSIDIAKDLAALIN